MNETLKRRLASLEREGNEKENLKAVKAYYDFILGDGPALTPQQLALVPPMLLGCMPISMKGQPQ